jgi:hypothetical protein
MILPMVYAIVPITLTVIFFVDPATLEAWRPRIVVQPIGMPPEK